MCAYSIQQLVLPLDVFLYSSLHAVPERVCPTAACAAFGRVCPTTGCAASGHVILHVIMLPHNFLSINVSVLRQPCSACGRFCPTAAMCCLWTCLFYSSLFCHCRCVISTEDLLLLTVSVLQHPVLPMDVCMFYVAACAAPGLVFPRGNWPTLTDEQKQL
jgi:hypothetical protein